MKGFVPIETKIAELIEEWADNHVRSGKDADWERVRGTREEDRVKRIHHHCEYLNAHHKDGLIIVHRGNGSLFPREQEHRLLNDLEDFLNVRTNVVVTVLGRKLDRPYHVDEDDVDLDRLKDISVIWAHPQFKYFNPTKEEVAIDVSRRKEETRGNPGLRSTG